MSVFFFFKQKTAYEMRISDWSSDVCPSDLIIELEPGNTVSPALVERLRPDMAVVQENADRFAPLVAEAVGFIKALVFSINLLGGLVLLPSFWALRKAVLGPME